MFKNFEKFTYSSVNNFPKDECVIQDVNEPDVFNAESVYQILYIDIRFPEEKYISYAKPYIWKDESGTALFGWASTTSSRIFGNVENSCQFYNEFVVGFVKADSNYVDADVRAFEHYKKLIDDQYDTFAQ